jgi:hypothetical protein
MNEAIYAKWLLDQNIKSVLLQGYVKSFNWSDLSHDGSNPQCELTIVPIEFDTEKLQDVYQKTTGQNPKKVLVIVVDE